MEFATVGSSFLAKIRLLARFFFLVFQITWEVTWQLLGGKVFIYVCVLGVGWVGVVNRKSLKIPSKSFFFSFEFISNTYLSHRSIYGVSTIGKVRHIINTFT